MTLSHSWAFVRRSSPIRAWRSHSSGMPAGMGRQGRSDRCRLSTPAHSSQADASATTAMSTCGLRADGDKVSRCAVRGAR
jgi:hypothetical protein